VADWDNLSKLGDAGKKFVEASPSFGTRGNLPFCRKVSEL
jgi:hypothetical protein